MKYVVGALLGLLAFWGAAIVGLTAESQAWHRDCRKLGAHVSDGVIYDCRPRQQQAGGRTL